MVEGRLWRVRLVRGVKREGIVVEHAMVWWMGWWEGVRCRRSHANIGEVMMGGLRCKIRRSWDVIMG